MKRVVSERVPVQSERVTCPEAKSDLTVEIWAVHNDGLEVGLVCHPRFGPGMGPHYFTRWESLEQMGKSLLEAAAVLKAGAVGQMEML